MQSIKDTLLKITVIRKKISTRNFREKKNYTKKPGLNMKQKCDEVQRNRGGGALGMVLISRLRVVELPIQGYTAGQVE